MFISRSGPATLTLKSIPSFMVHHIQSILPRPRWTASDWTHVSRAPSLPFSPLCWLLLVSLCIGRQLVTQILDLLPPAFPDSLLPCPVFPAYSSSSTSFQLPVLLVTDSLVTQFSDKSAKCAANGRVRVINAHA